MSELIELDEAAIRARLEAATPGPWEAVVLGSEGYDVRAARPRTPGRLSRVRVARCGYEEWEVDKANAEFIAHARTDAERLLAALNEARAEVKRLAHEERRWHDASVANGRLSVRAEERAESAETQVERLHFDLDREAHARQAAERERDEARNERDAEVLRADDLNHEVVTCDRLDLLARAEAAESALAAVGSDLKTLAFDMHRGWKHVRDGADAAVLIDKFLDSHATLATPTTTDTTTEGDKA